MRLLVVLALCAVAAVATAGRKEGRTAGRCTTAYRGCKLQAGHCKCGTQLACHNPFPYKSKHECTLDKQGRGDRCKKEPCRHKGQCVQANTNGHRSWQCQCAGTGFYGTRCGKKCPPEDKRNPLPRNYPVACIY
ncbi:hypothetical protein NP493_673g01021 [Ridgeia piscesae]|uniref:EGF-like domain-containing protein n=1 Tax=Ridgeia piscesae TaxID=27915 RepID=A0AAD9NPW1_RIDPI|nr:hypothetical protein NP493_673g01021 [Ridgeia piscesae]